MSDNAKKKGNAKFVWPALLLILIICPIAGLNGYYLLGAIIAAAGVGLLVYAMATGRLTLFG